MEGWGKIAAVPGVVNMGPLLFGVGVELLGKTPHPDENPLWSTPKPNVGSDPVLGLRGTILRHTDLHPTAY